MTNLCTAAQEFVSPQRKCQYLQFVAPYFSMPELQRIGFDTAVRSYGTAKKWFYNNGNKVASVPLQQGGHKVNADLRYCWTECIPCGYVKGVVLLQHPTKG